MAVLVTGAAGFIGASAVSGACSSAAIGSIGIDNLNDYYDPALKRAPARQARQAITGTIPTSSGSISPMRRRWDGSLSGTEFDRIVHLGAQAGVRYSIENPQRLRPVQPGRASQHAGARPRTAAPRIWSMPPPRRSTAATRVAVPGRGPRRSSAVALRRHQEGGRADERKPMPSLSVCRRPACASSPSTGRGAGPTWRCGSSPKRSSRASRSSSSTGRDAARLHLHRRHRHRDRRLPRQSAPDDGAVKAGGSSARTRSTISATANPRT